MNYLENELRLCIYIGTTSCYIKEIKITKAFVEKRKVHYGRRSRIFRRALSAKYSAHLYGSQSKGLQDHFTRDPSTHKNRWSH
ncbi:hypothetical protein V1478_011897 [Vespula squamosa]|uniref:Uncharacterized protein n=1 Tax=Vespula squamosa TaxID=30214 RepID=A0ABD2ABR7_VESSQ